MTRCRMNFYELTLCGRFRGTILSWTVAAVLPIIILLFSVAFFTDSWSRIEVLTGLVRLNNFNLMISGGLWKRCDHFSGRAYCRSLLGTEETSGEFIASQGFNSFSLFGSIMALIVLSAYLLIQRFQRDTRAAITIAFFLYGAAIFGVLGCITYAAGDQKDFDNMARDAGVVYHYGWGFGLATSYNIMTTFLAILMTVEVTKSRNMIPA